eukprot:s874_g10.t1
MEKNSEEPALIAQLQLPPVEKTGCITELWFLLCTVQAGNWDACVDGKAFSSSKSKTSCSCDRYDDNASTDSTDPSPTCLLNSDEKRVVPYFLEPDSEKPLPVKVMEDLYFFRTASTTAIPQGSCPSGFARGSRELPDPGFYKYSPTYLSPGLSQFMGCEQVRRCPPGYYCDRGGLNPPLACGKGVLCNESGLVTPRPCPAGFYCPTSLIALECFQGSFCPERSMVPRSCRKGFWCPNPCSEHKCPSGQGLSERLPDGVTKRTLRHPPTRKYLPPEQGDEVVVRYSLTVAGQQLQSTGTDGITFTIGAAGDSRGPPLQVLHTLVRQLYQGEDVEFTLELSMLEDLFLDGWAPNTQTQLQLELVKCPLREDLFGDQGAIKRIIKSSEGRHPKDGDECQVSYKISSQGAARTLAGSYVDTFGPFDACSVDAYDTTKF